MIQPVKKGIVKQPAGHICVSYCPKCGETPSGYQGERKPLACGHVVAPRYKHVPKPA